MRDDRRDAIRNDAAHFLGLIVEQEAKRILTDESLAADPSRLAGGWERRFVTDAGRLDEVVSLYEALGFDVCADPIRAVDLGDDCEDCHLVALRGFRMVYTRPKGERT